MENSTRVAIFVGAVIAVAVAGILAYVLIRPAPSQPPEPADIGVVEFSASPSTVGLGENVKISALIRNDGGVRGSEAFALTVDGEVTGREIVSLGPGESEILSFSVTGEDLGTHSAELGGRSDTFEVAEPADIRVTGLSVSPGEVEEGKTVKAIVGVRNFSQMPGSERIELSIDNGRVARKVRLDGGESDNLSFGIGRGLGKHTVSVGAWQESFRVFEPPREAIGLIEVNFPIIYGNLVDYVNAMVNYSLETENVEAVVLKVSSPGGAAAYVEEIYRNLLELKRKKPVVACIVGVGASGGYYISLPSDHLYAEPSAWVGSIGVYSTKPSVTRPKGKIYETGPYKRTGFSVKHYPLLLEDVLGHFVGAVEERRGKSLELDRRDMIKGKIYHGARAAELGLIDSTGSITAAKEKAASLAGVENYRIVDVGWQVLSSPSPGLRTGKVRALLENYAGRERWSDRLTPELLEGLDSKFFYLHGVGEERIRSNVTILDEWSGESAGSGSTLPQLGSGNPDNVQENRELRGGPGENLVLVDAAHSNAFEDGEINPLLQELVERGAKMEYFTGLSLEEELENANAFVTIAPRTGFTEEEVGSLEEFVEGGGKILMAADPTRSDVTYINSLAKEFETTFTPGYLYNMENHYGIYRNIYVGDLENVGLFEGVERLNLLTATEVASAGSEVATTSRGTYLSTNEEAGKYGVMSLSENGSVLALGDFTMLTRPWNTLESNSRFLSNLADFLTEVKAPEEIGPKPRENKVENPDTLVVERAQGPRTLDPAVTYHEESREVLLNVYEPLLLPGDDKLRNFRNVLASDWEVGDNGRTYRFRIREGVSFHNGNELTPEDVEYSIERLMVVDRAGGPAWTVLEPLLGVRRTRGAGGGYKVTYENIDSSVTVDNEWVVFHLVRPYAPFPSVLTRSWTAILDREWAVDQGAWPGTAETWKDYNNPRSSPLAENANGAGPFELSEWREGSRAVLIRNEDYWRDPPELKKVEFNAVEEWNARKGDLLDGEADVVDVPRSEVDELVDAERVTVVDNLPTLRTDPAALFQFSISESSDYIGSGRLDGGGIPPDFFSHTHVRKAFAYAFGSQEFIENAFHGLGSVVPGPIPTPLGDYYSDNREAYAQDLEKAEKSFKRGYGGTVEDPGPVWENGFKFTLPYLVGENSQKIAARNFERNVEKINDNFEVEVEGLRVRNYYTGLLENRLPMFFMGWFADFPDPHNFVKPFMDSGGTFAGWQNYSDPHVDNLVEKGISTTGFQERKEIYGELQDIYHEDVPSFPLCEPMAVHCERDWVQGYRYNPALPGVYAYPMSKG